MSPLPNQATILTVAVINVGIPALFDAACRVAIVDQVWMPVVNIALFPFFFLAVVT